MKTFKIGFFAVLASAGLVAGSAFADDTEVFFPPVDGAQTETVRPNILFIMDTSGSMGSTDGTNSTRLDKVKDALTKILDEMSPNTNVGLMRLSDDEGGPVLFPVSHIEASADDIEKSCSIEDDEITLTGYATGSTGETAQEDVVSGLTVQDPPVLVAGLIPGVSGGSKESSFRGRAAPNKNSSYDDAQQRSNGRNFTYKESYLQLGYRDVGLRFPGITIPKGAVITSAVLQIAVNRDKKDSNTNIVIYGEAVNDSPDFRDNSDVVNRRTTTEKSPNWSVPQSSNGTSLFTSPSFHKVIDEIVNKTPGWAEGNAITLLLKGSGRRYMLNNTAGADRPRLIIKYQTAAQVATATQVGMRFAAMNIPQGVTIKSAYIDFVPAALNTDKASFVFKGEAAIDSESLTSGIKQLSKRPRTSASTDWTESDVGVWDTLGGLINPGYVETGPDIKNIIQEVVNQPQWCGGNAITVFLESSALNDGIRSFYSGETSSDFAPVLRVSYSGSDPKAKTGCRQSIGLAPVASSSDDAEERLSNGSVSLASSDLELTTDGSNNQIVGMRFTNVQIAQGSEVIEAFLNLTARDTSLGASSLTITVEDDAAPDTFSSATRHLSNRSSNVVSGSVSWSPDDFEEDGELIESPDISALIQQVVNQPSWKPGSSIVVFIKGSGTRRVWSVDGSSANAPKLFYRAKGYVQPNTVRQRLKELVGDFSSTGFTPVVEVMTEAAKYYRGESVYFGRTRGSGERLNDGDGGSGQDDLVSARQMRISHCASYTGGKQIDPPGCTPDNLNASACETQRIENSPVYISPITDACQSNNIVLLTDGLPNNNNHAGLVSDITGSSCSGDSCGPALAYALAHADQNSTLAGDQKIFTYTIGFADFGAKDYLEDIAAKGLGTFSPAADAETLASRFREIIALILDQDSTFVAPAVTINSFNRLTHLDQLYFALFQPQVEVDWNGNLKRFRLVANPGRIVDAKGAPAVDPDTGFFYDDVTSFWTDTGPDGGNVRKGGAASELGSPATRKIYTNVSGSTLTATNNRLDKSNTAITKAMLDMVGEDDAERDRVLDWARGLDVNDEDADGSRTDTRHAIGDPLHSEPVLVSYGGTEESQDITIFMGTNDGFIHAFDGPTGEEYFAFIPKELLPNLRVYERNNGAWYSRPYGMDGPLITYSQGSGASKKIFVVAGMRRGGRSYYALDVTNRSAPRIEWSITGGVTSGFSELGQTWSTPINATVSYAGAATDVLVFGGGYDENQDTPLSTPRIDTQGRALYVVRASDGKLLWSAGSADAGTDYVVSDMLASVPATPGVIDLNGDGLADRIYISDMNAKVFRFDINPENSGRSNFATGGMIAHLGGSDAANNRRFYNAPDISLSIPEENSPILTISVGSGYRAHPLEAGVQDRFFVLFDPDITVGSVQMFKDGPIDDPLTQLYDASANKLGSSDPDVSEAERVKLYSKRGAYINLRPSEKALTASRTFDNKVVFSTFEPGAASSGNICSAGVGLARLYVLNVLGLTPADDLNESGGDLTTGDRDKELAVRGIPPNPVILFPDPGQDEPIRPVIFVGPESYQPNVQVSAQKTSWQTQDPPALQLNNGGGGQ